MQLWAFATEGTRMQPIGGGSGSRRSGGRGGRRDAGGGAVRKGPWTAEEDEVLLEHVRTHGPRDWSSIRSKCLLPRTGKSCRLRWVNKLRPDLKTGCKFSPEEERVVIELQAQFGNKWATIATHLPGRTDNDVKNFWSTRQKRLARILRAPLPARSNKNGSSWVPVSSNEPQPPKGPCLDVTPFEISSPSAQFCPAQPFVDDQNAVQLQIPPQTTSGFLSFEAALSPCPPATDGEGSTSSAAPLAPELPFNQHQYPLLDFPGLPDSGDLSAGFFDVFSMDDLAYQEPLPIMPHNAVKTEPQDVPNFFFDDLPLDMFDSLDQLPPPSPPLATNTQL